MGIKNLLGLIKRERRERDNAKDTSKVEKLVKILLNKNKQTEDRIRAIELLSEMDTPESIAGLCRRFDMTLEKETMDRNEKEYVIKILESKGEKAVQPISDFINSSDNITLATMVLEKIAKEERTAMILIDALKRLEGDFESNPDKKVQLIKMLTMMKAKMAVPHILPFLKDFDESVRFASIDFIGSIGDRTVRDELLKILCDDQEESQRIKYRIFEICAENSWDVKGYRKKVEEIIPDEFFLNREGVVRKKDAGWWKR